MITIHFPFVILHLPFDIAARQAVAAMTNDQSKMENGKWKCLKILA
jgi:hypothetical protein